MIRVGLDRNLVVVGGFGVDDSVGARDVVLSVVTAVAAEFAVVFVVVVARVVGSGLIVEISLDDEDRSREHGWIGSELMYK